MKRVIVFKHVAHDALGTLDQLLRNEGLRIRYVNFGREPEARPEIEKYDAIIVYGGWMGVYEADKYPHIKTECELLERALRLDKPIMGICLGAQILAHTLGAQVRKHTNLEVGWKEVNFKKAAQEDPLFQGYGAVETVFQMHGDTFDLPAQAVHLASSEICENQAFRYGEKVYGLQFHLETELRMIQRFLHHEESRKEAENFAGKMAIEQMESDSRRYLPRSVALSQATFHAFLDLIGHERRHRAFKHGKE